VIIRPRPIPDPDPKVLDDVRLGNAETELANTRDATLEGKPYVPPGKDEWDGKSFGTGLGSDAEILFNPGVYRDAMGQVPPFTPFEHPDCGLLHELVHAMSAVSGTAAQEMGGPDTYKNLEEFTACVVENVYRSEHGYGVLRGGHGYEIMPLLLRGSQAFYNRYSNYMQQVCANHPWLAGELHKATGIAHNPFVFCTGV
jgi:hypothetical protein